MKVTYNFDCHCCVEDIELNVPENATNEEIEQAIFNDIVARYANNFDWKKEKEGERYSLIPTGKPVGLR